MRLTRDLAQKIVDNTMNVLGKNINIMNHDGVIIGSGDQNRINTYHEVASIVLKSGKPSIIKQGDVNQFKGVRAGINLPIKFNEEIIGVVGITGDVNEVSGYGEIVKNMVELILQREFLRQEMELENKALEHFYQQLLSNSLKDKDLLNDRVRLLNVKDASYRVVFVIKVNPFDSKEINTRIQKTRFSFVNAQDIFLIRGENIVLIKTLGLDKKPKSPEIFKIAKNINKEFADLNPVIGIGQVFYGLDMLYLSYQGAKHALQVGSKIYKNKPDNIFYLNHLGYDYFLPCIEPSSMKQHLKHFFDKDLFEIFADDNVGEIIEALVENDINISKAAEQLYIHRNTLLYRLKKVEKKIGLDPKKAANLFSLLFSYHLYLYHQSDI